MMVALHSMYALVSSLIHAWHVVIVFVEYVAVVVLGGGDDSDGEGVLVVE